VYLGLDLGTTNIKALAVNPQGKIVARGAQEVPLIHTPDGGVEQDIEQIWQATLKAIKSAAEKTDLADIKAVGVSSQGAAIQIRTTEGKCVGPVISWMDARGRPFDEKFQKRIGEKWLTQRMGHGVSAMSIGQSIRLREQDPELLAPPNILGYVGDAIVQRLTGNDAHDKSSLSIAGLYNPSLGQPDPELLKKLDLTAEQLPKLIPAGQAAGSLKPQIAKETRLPADIPVGPAIHDQYAAAVGCGAIDTGDLMFGAGTAWALLAVTDHLSNPVGPAAWVCDHIVPGRWGQLLSLVVGGSALKWALDMTGSQNMSPEKIDETIDSIPPGADGLRLWPFMDAIGGQNRPKGGRIYDIKLAHTKEHLLRATLEGLCFELTRQIGWLEKAGCPIKRLIMCGGASQSRVTPQIVADVTHRPVTCPQETEISAFGAAIIARAMIEKNTTIEKLFESMAGNKREIKPGKNAGDYAPMVKEYIQAVDAAGERFIYRRAIHLTSPKRKRVGFLLAATQRGARRLAHLWRVACDGFTNNQETYK